MTFSCWIKETFLVEQQVLSPSWKHTKLHKPDVFPLTTGWIIIQNPGVLTDDAFYSKICSCVFLRQRSDYVILSKSGMTTKQAVIKMKVSKPRPARVVNYQSLQETRKQEQMKSFRDVCASITKEVLFPLKGETKMFAVYYDKDIDMLRLGCTYQVWPTCVYTNQQIPSSIPSRTQIKT